MRLLLCVEDSVLWLFGGDETVERNLSREAAAHGVDPNRLIFAPRVPYNEYLARYALADLFLDTSPYNAGTTASDALWAGLPVVTCSGRSFVSRMAGSLLHAAGLPELVTYSPADYEALAIRLAQEPGTLARLKARLMEGRDTLPLFDVDRFRRNIEQAYVEMWERWRRGEIPSTITLQE